MNNILASGFARYNAGSLNTYINLEDYESTIIGKYAGDALIGNSRYRNVFLGYKSGQLSTNTLENIFIGWESGINVKSGSNNILLGRENEFETNIIENLNNTISIGFLNKLKDESIIIGNENINNGIYNIILGKNNDVLGEKNIISGYENINNGLNNISFGYNNNIIGNKNIIYGTENNISGFNSIFIGNNNIVQSNIDNSLIFGNNNFCNSNNVILIGFDLNNSNINYSLNIADTICNYKNEEKNILFLGLNSNNFSSAIGYTTDDISNIENKINSNEKHSLYIKDGIYTNKITLENNYLINNSNLDENSNIIIDIIQSNNYITLTANSNITKSINYILPSIPINTSNIFLSTKDTGELYWDNITKYTTNINTNTNINISNSDYIKEGTSNLYFTNNRFNINFDNRLNYLYPNGFNNINLDNIINGTSNKYITNNVYPENLLITGTLTVGKLQVLGIDFGKKNINDILNDTIALQQEIKDNSNFIVNYINNLNDIKQNIITGAATTVLYNNLINDRVLISDVNGKITSSSITNNELNNLIDLSKNITGTGSIILNNNPIINTPTFINTTTTNDIITNGNITATGTILQGFSDIRLKNKIDNISKPLDLLSKLNGFKYRANDLAVSFGYDNNIIDFGLSAQEVNNILPELVSIAPFDRIELEKGKITSKSGEKYLTINYERLIPILIESIKELKNENIVLQNKLENNIIDTSNIISSFYNHLKTQ